ncbi:hypothetical protein H8356DRAFT_1320476 [Neocallimastix lanati (nom. inval.)]|nr:hypothetical protein H8356DRAFT_1320476 [Neocallimastix sp. JGI-2020a]
MKNDNCKKRLQNILKGDYNMFKQKFKEDLYLNKISFSYYDKNRRSISSIINDHERSRYKTFNDGYKRFVKNYENSLLFKYVFMLVNPHVYSNMAIPQQNDINLNNKGIKYDKNWSIYKGINEDFDENKINNNGADLIYWNKNILLYRLEEIIKFENNKINEIN